jgi:HNH endonuclease
MTTTIYRGNPRRYIHGHNPIPMLSAEKRFWSKVNKHGRMIDRKIGRCWEWEAHKRGQGYGGFHLEGGEQNAHRALWKILYGSIPIKMEVHHKCNNRICVRPSHLALVTHAENVKIGSLRITKCPRGHALVRATPYLWSRGRRRFCRICKTEKQRIYRKQFA